MRCISDCDGCLLYVSVCGSASSSHLYGFHANHTILHTVSPTSELNDLVHHMMTYTLYSP